MCEGGGGQERGGGRECRGKLVEGERDGRKEAWKRERRSRERQEREKRRGRRQEEKRLMVGSLMLLLKRKPRLAFELQMKTDEEVCVSDCVFVCTCVCVYVCVC